MPAGLTLGSVGDLYVGKPLAGETDAGFLAAVDLLRSTDVRFGNLEFQLLEPGAPGAHAAPGAWAGAPESFADDIAWLGMDVVATANNHAGDYGEGGQRSTQAMLHARGIAQCGTGPDLDQARAPVYADTPQGRIAFVAASSSFVAHARAGRARDGVQGRQGVAPLRFGTRYQLDDQAFEALQRILAELPVQQLSGHREQPLERRFDGEHGQGLRFFGTEFVRGERFAVESWPAPNDLQEMQESVRRARQHADFVVASLHSHEYDATPEHPAAFAQQACMQLVEAGADAVIGHGAHGVRGIQLHRGKPIFYGVGAFVFQPYLFPSQPSDFFEAYSMEASTLAETYALRKERAGFFRKRAYWEAMLVRLSFTRGAAPGFQVSPIVLWPEGGEPDGLPRLAHNPDGLELLRKISRLSVELGTALQLDEHRFSLFG